MCKIRLILIMSLLNCYSRILVSAQIIEYWRDALNDDENCYDQKLLNVPPNIIPSDDNYVTNLQHVRHFKAPDGIAYKIYNLPVTQQQLDYYNNFVNCDDDTIDNAPLPGLFLNKFNNLQDHTGEQKMNVHSNDNGEICQQENFDSRTKTNGNENAPFVANAQHMKSNKTDGNNSSEHNIKWIVKNRPKNKNLNEHSKNKSKKEMSNATKESNKKHKTPNNKSKPKNKTIKNDRNQHSKKFPANQKKQKTQKKSKNRNDENAENSEDLHQQNSKKSSSKTKNQNTKNKKHSNENSENIKIISQTNNKLSNNKTSINQKQSRQNANNSTTNNNATLTKTKHHLIDVTVHIDDDDDSDKDDDAEESPQVLGTINYNCVAKPDERNLPGSTRFYHEPIAYEAIQTINKTNFQSKPSTTSYSLAFPTSYNDNRSPNCNRLDGSDPRRSYGESFPNNPTRFYDYNQFPSSKNNCLPRLGKSVSSHNGNNPMQFLNLDFNPKPNSNRNSNPNSNCEPNLGQSSPFYNGNNPTGFNSNLKSDSNQNWKSNRRSKPNSNPQRNSNYNCDPKLGQNSPFHNGNHPTGFNSNLKSDSNQNWNLNPGSKPNPDSKSNSNNNCDPKLGQSAPPSNNDNNPTRFSDANLNRKLNPNSNFDNCEPKLGQNYPFNNDNNPTGFNLNPNLNSNSNSNSDQNSNSNNNCEPNLGQFNPPSNQIRSLYSKNTIDRYQNNPFRNNNRGKIVHSSFAESPVAAAYENDNGNGNNNNGNGSGNVFRNPIDRIPLLSPKMSRDYCDNQHSNEQDGGVLGFSPFDNKDDNEYGNILQGGIFNPCVEEYGKGYHPKSYESYECKT